MKIHPSPQTHNATVRPTTTRHTKKLRRLPHIFEKVLELPFLPDADVSIYETSDSLRFIVVTDDDISTSDISAHTVEICAGVIKVVVRCGGGIEGVGEMEVDELWRFRLPEYTVPELATASFGGGELVVTVPKEAVFVDEGVWGSGNNGNGNVVLVQ
ncbi:hypothetical protein CTI12_AA060120 [Artemisia annua]|uniref:SHSP domain-containing protein n=1 Tax=Artemisia annua TaxID=35608 RepID=A0A2U1PW70_ARTAN|nr:hypothetical protein CTI12_AA060120 [Artemisia annua]